MYVQAVYKRGGSLGVWRSRFSWSEEELVVCGIGLEQIAPENFGGAAKSFVVLQPLEPKDLTMSTTYGSG